MATHMLDVASWATGLADSSRVAAVMRIKSGRNTNRGKPQSA